MGVPCGGKVWKYPKKPPEMTLGANAGQTGIRNQPLGEKWERDLLYISEDRGMMYGQALNTAPVGQVQVWDCTGVVRAVWFLIRRISKFLCPGIQAKG